MSVDGRFFILEQRNASTATTPTGLPACRRADMPSMSPQPGEHSCRGTRSLLTRSLMAAMSWRRDARTSRFLGNLAHARLRSDSTRNTRSRLLPECPGSLDPRRPLIRVQFAAARPRVPQVCELAPAARRTRRVIECLRQILAKSAAGGVHWTLSRHRMDPSTSARLGSALLCSAQPALLCSVLLARWRA